MIKVKAVNKTFRRQTVLKNISLSLAASKCHGFIGNNGSGKSLLLKSICGFITIDSGEISINNYQIIGGKQFIKNAGVLIESPEWINHLSGEENLQILANIQNKITVAQIKNVLNLVGLTEAANKKVKKYSLGMKQRLRIAQAIMEDPEILILDEPFNGLDKRAVLEMQTLLNNFKVQGKTILLTSHDERNIEFLCDKTYELEAGALV